VLKGEKVPKKGVGRLGGNPLDLQWRPRGVRGDWLGGSGEREIGVRNCYSSTMLGGIKQGGEEGGKLNDATDIKGDLEKEQSN